MASKYNLFFVPHLNDRKKISSLRTSICKKIHSAQALQYPVHMSLISGGFRVKNYLAFEKELRHFCNKQSSITLKSFKNTVVLPDRFWTGIHIIRTDNITHLQKELQKLRNKHAIKKEKHPFHPPHITLAFPAKVGDLKKLKCPVNSMKLDRITIVKKEDELSQYRIYKHIKMT